MARRNKDKNNWWWLLLGIVPLAFLLANQHDSERLFKEKWLGFYHPVDCPECEFEFYHSPELPSLEVCKQWGNTIKDGRSKTGEVFTCGRDCKENQDGEFICKQLYEF